MREVYKITEMKVSIVIPAYNEEQAIGEVIDGIRYAMDNTEYDYEIIVVDDCSSDSTSKIAKDKGVKVIRHLENKGVGKARKTGIQHAEGDIIVMTDADGTYPVKDIPKLLEYFPEYDMVIGARKVEAGTVPWLRRPVKFILRKLAEYVTRKRMPDLNSGLRAFKKDIAMKFLNLLPNGHSWVSTITIAFLSNGYDVKYVPIDYYKRKGKSTIHPIRDTSAFFLLIFRTIMYFKPLRVFLPLAAIILIGGIIRTIYDARILHHVKESDVMIILTGVLTLILGLLADLIVKTRQI